MLVSLSCQDPPFQGYGSPQMANSWLFYNSQISRYRQDDISLYRTALISKKEITMKVKQRGKKDERNEKKRKRERLLRYPGLCSPRIPKESIILEVVLLWDKRLYEGSFLGIKIFVKNPLKDLKFS